MVRREFPFGVGLLSNLGLFNGMVDTFFIVEGDRRLPLGKDAVIQDAPCVHHGHGATSILLGCPPNKLDTHLAVE